MDGSRFDRLTRALTSARPHRRAVATMLAAIVGACIPLPVTAGKGGKKGKKRKKGKSKAKVKVTFSKEECQRMRETIVTNVNDCANWHPTDFGSGVQCVTALEACLDLIGECGQPSVKQDQAILRAQVCNAAAFDEWYRCTDDGDCSVEEICDSGSRRCKTGCRGSWNCPFHKRFCLQGQCISIECVDGDDCPSDRPFCDEANACVSCITGACVAPLPYCFAGDCKECLIDSHCPAGPMGRPFCYDYTCRRCRGDSDCATPTPYCFVGDCVECVFPSHCPDGPLGRGACDANNRCAFLP